MDKKRRKLLVVTAAVLLLSLFVFSLILFSQQRSSLVALEPYQMEGNSLSVVAQIDGSRGVMQFEPKLKLDGQTLKECMDDTTLPCFTTEIENDTYWYFKIANLAELEGSKLEWVDTVAQMFGAETTSIQIPSTETDSLPTFERMYGMVLDKEGELVPDALVSVSSEQLDQDYVTKTTEDGTYVLILPDLSDGYLQDIKVITPQGFEGDLRTSSNYNKPVADLIVDGTLTEDSGAELSSSLLFKASAANSCVKSTDQAGIRSQCHETVPWNEFLDTRTCPTGSSRFRVGLIKSTTVTKFHNPETVSLQLVDVTNGTVVKDSSGNPLKVPNGGYIDGEVVGLVKDRQYIVKAYDGGTECTNTNTDDPRVVYRVPEDRTGPQAGNSGGNNGGNGGNDGGGNDGGANGGTLPPITGEMNLCKKVGNNFAVPYRIPAEDIQKGVSIGMRWGEALITDLAGMPDYVASVSDANNLGMNVILRICYKNNCNINDGTSYGQAIVEAFNELLATGRLPQDGLFAHAGHNEPNNAEYLDPVSEANFLIGVVNAVDSAGLLGQQLGEASIKLLSPNLDLFISQNGQWPGCSDGCDDPNPHAIYTAQSYIDEMLKVDGFKDAADKLYAWAVNDYLYQRGPDSVSADVDGFYTAYLQARGLIGRIFITETGNYAPPGQQPTYDWSVLANTLATLESKEYVEGFLLFNALGTNRDPAFEYHKPLWDDMNLLKSLFSNCVIGAYDVPQEGEVPVSTSGTGGGPSAGSSPPSSAPSIPFNGAPSATPGSPSASGGPHGAYGSSYNGADPCLGGICVGKDYTSNAVALGGLINGNFEGGFVNDGAPEIEVPMFWHAWYQNGCQAGLCGVYSCTDDEKFCKRPEFKPSSGDNEVNRRVAGEQSVKYFTTYATHYAGLFQQIKLGLGGDNTLKLVASASSWSDGKKCEGFGTGQCEESDGCVCSIINKFIGRIGIDPTGGIDPTAGTVVWSDWKELPNVGPEDGANFVEFVLDTNSPNEYITVFLASNNEYPYRNSDSYWDGIELYVNGFLAIGDDGGSVTQSLPFGGAGAGAGGTAPGTSLQCQDIGTGTNFDNACWVTSVGCESLCPGGYYEGISPHITPSSPLPPAGSCPWGRSSAQCPAGCGVVPPADGKMGNHCCMYVCIQDWDGNFDDPRIPGNGALPSADQFMSVLGESTPPVIRLDERGEYEIFAEGYMSEPIYVANFERTPLEIPVFQDLDQDGEYDPNEPYAPDVSMVTVERIGDAVQLELREGINLSSIPFYNEEFTNASDVLDEIVEQGGLATSIAVYRNLGASSGWNLYSKVGNQSYGEDFQFRPGDAIFVVLRESVELKLRGTDYAEPVQQYVRAGWNLLAIKGTNADYDASTVIDEIAELPGVEASAVAIWDSTRGSYRQFIFEGREEFGSEFTITDEHGIFLLVDSGVGYWVPRE